MRAARISLLVLALLVGSALACGALMDARCDAWTEQLDTAERAVLRGDWQTAEAALRRLESDWQAWQPPLHTVMEHREIDETDVLLRRCLLLCGEKEAAALRAAASDLRCQLTHLADMERLSLQNVL